MRDACRHLLVKRRDAIGDRRIAERIEEWRTADRGAPLPSSHAEYRAITDSGKTPPADGCERCRGRRRN